MNNTNNALETLVQRDKQIKKTNDKLKASINELDAELETTTNALSTHASNTEIHTSKEELIQFIVDHLESLDLGITKEVVSELPTENISDNTLYLVPNSKGSHNEYLYINDKWELVGSTETNLTDYYTKLETNSLLEGKANSKHNHVVSDITDMPTIPTKTSQLINDSGFITSSSGVITSVSWSDIKDKPNFSTVATSGSYTDLSNTPTIPTKVSQLENDTGFINGLSDVVDTKSNQTINGTKKFTADIVRKYTAVDITATPTSDMYSHINFVDKNDQSVAYIQYAQKTNGVDYIGLRVRDKNSNTWGVQLNTDKEFIPLGNNSYSLGSSSYKWANVYSTNDITNKVITYSVTSHDNTSSITVSGGSSWDTGSTLFLYGNSHSNYPGAFNLTAKNTTNESKLIGFPNGTLTWGGKSLAIDENLVHTSGDETINGTKKFTSDIVRKYTAVDITATPTSDMYAHINFTDKNDKSVAYIQYAQRSNGVDYIGLRVRDKNSNTWGVQLNTNKEFVPLGNNSYSLGSSSLKWANVYATTFNGNLKGNADSATYATTQATTDNSTKIATTAWVRTYVNSVVGANTVGSSVSAYWSNSSNVTATGQTSATNGYYPAGYSEYITKTPTVGTIYSGAQLYTVLNTYASATGSKNNTTGIFFTNTTAQAIFSTSINPSGKYLCTTANTVKFRAYTATGSTSAVGSSSVVDNSSTKSIFIRVQ